MPASEYVRASARPRHRMLLLAQILESARWRSVEELCWRADA
jgi:hypothetical protein